MKKALFILVASIGLLSSCNLIEGKRIKGNGVLKTEERTVAEFTGVASHGSFDVIVSNGTSGLKIEAEENVLPYIETSVENGILHIRTKDGYWISSKQDGKIYVTAPVLNSIKSFGSGNISGSSKITAPAKLELKVTGSADIDLELDAPEVEGEITGSGNMNVRGETKKFTGIIAGSGDIKAYDLKSEETTVKISGSGNADVFASVKLEVKVAGSGDVNYKGGAEVSSSIAGSGTVKKVD